MKDLSTISTYRASSDDVDGLLTLRVDPLEEGRSTLRAWPNRAVICNRSLVWCSAGIDYEMPELGSDGLVLRIRTLSVEPPVTLHVLLNSGRRSCADIDSGRGTQISYSAAVDLVENYLSHQKRLLVLRLVARLRDFVGHKMLLERTVEVQGDNNYFNHLRDWVCLITSRSRMLFQIRSSTNFSTSNADGWGYGKILMPS
ncbi:hypothetical protein M9H77_30442 [Catharanthus roseus]|uniref:Uncharacterized protein n=1 Tax=Catharanthus roseus TaxID=4058 RepID=A0ACB9ZZ42_CATRO|nr:hypothetical protein M9H77_30442 [Catharanthus roseus]